MITYNNYSKSVKYNVELLQCLWMFSHKLQDDETHIEDINFDQTN